VDYRLVNRLCGSVVEIIENEYNPHFARVVMVKLDDPRCNNGEVFPVFPSRDRFSSMSIFYFPLKLFYALNIFRIQGQTIDRAIVKLSCAELFRHCKYTAISRVRRLGDLSFFDDDNLRLRRFNSPPTLHTAIVD